MTLCYSLNQKKSYKAVDESKKKGLTINCKKAKKLVVRKRETPKWTLRIRDITIKQVEKFEYSGSIISDNGKLTKELE